MKGTQPIDAVDNLLSLPPIIVIGFQAFSSLSSIITNSNSFFIESEVLPKFDPTQVVEVFVRIIGGEVKVASSLASKIGLLSFFPKKRNFKGLEKPLRSSLCSSSKIVKAKKENFK